MALSTPRFHGLDLPVFEGPEIIGNFEIDKQAIAATRTVQGDRFVRVLKIGARGYDSLGDVLETTEREFANLEEVCELKVVEHTWGLCAIDSLRMTVGHYKGETEARLLPEGYLLGALVSVIDVESEYAKHADQINARVAEYWERGGLLSDLPPSQFSNGVEKTTGRAGDFLHDIDPFLKDNR